MICTVSRECLQSTIFTDSGHRRLLVNLEQIFTCGTAGSPSQVNCAHRKFLSAASAQAKSDRNSSFFTSTVHFYHAAIECKCHPNELLEQVPHGDSYDTLDTPAKWVL